MMNGISGISQKFIQMAYLRACLGVTRPEGLRCHLVLVTPTYVVENETFLVNKYLLVREVKLTVTF